MALITVHSEYYLCDSATPFLCQFASSERVTAQGEPVDEGDLFDGAKGLRDLIPEQRLVERFGAAPHRRFAK
jgi:hypothetical protein